MGRFMSRDYSEVQFHLRLPYEIHAKIKQRAKNNNRSINAEILHTLEESFSNSHQFSEYHDEAERKADACAKEIKSLVFSKLTEFYRDK